MNASAYPTPQRRKWVWALFVLAALGFAALPLPNAATEPTDRYFRVEASAYEFTPAVLHVNAGDRVTIELVSTDVVHGLHLDVYGLETTADPGQPTRLSFTADRSGVFRFRCSVTCGAMHPFMIGKLKVGNDGILYRGLGLAILAAFAGRWGRRR